MFYNRSIPLIGQYPGRDAILGIAGTGAEPVAGKRYGQIFYVDPSHPDATDGSLGTDPRWPLATLQSLIDRTLANVKHPHLENYDTVYIQSSLTENVNTYDYDVMPSYVSLVGAGRSMYSPYWEPANQALPILDLRAVGWHIEGLRFMAPTGAACIELHHTDLTGSDIAIRTQIVGNLFDGLTVGRYGILSHGCYDVWIVNNTFQLFHNAVAGGAIPLFATLTPLAIPYRNHIIGNIFWDSDNGAIFPCNGSEFSYNMFQPVGYAYSMTQVLNTSIVANPGDDNVVFANTFPGDYSIAGGYRPGAADVWVGNFADDVAEAEVGDNGLTIARPT